MAKTLYINLDDDIPKITALLKDEKSAEVVLVFPKKSFIFSDSINLRLLKKQVDLLGKQASIMTMDEKGQTYAQEAGFAIKRLPKTSRTSSVSDIKTKTTATRKTATKKATSATKTVAIPAAAEPATQTPPPVSSDVSEAPHEPAVAPVAEPVPSPRKRVVAQSRVKVASEVSTPIHKTENVFLPPDSEKITLPKHRSMGKYIVAFIVVALIVAVALVFVVLPSGEVTVYAKSQSIARDIEITANIGTRTPDSAQLIVPAIAAGDTSAVSDTFQTNGKKEVGSKAQGRVAIYNLTGSPLNLKATTTVLSVGSKNYTFTADQTGIKALSSASNDQNATVADIIANEGGDGFNLPAGTRLEITNQAFGSQPQRLYAKTVTQVIGGASRFVSVISKDDIQKAKDSLTAKLMSKVEAELKTKNMMFIDGSYSATLTDFTTDKPEDTEAPTFSAQGTVAISGLAVGEAAIKDMIRQRLKMSLGAGKNLQDAAQDKITYKVKNLDTTNGIMQLSLHYDSLAVPTVDEQGIRAQIAGKNKTEASELILSNPDVDRVDITVYPAWQSTLPRFGNKIKLEIKR